MAFLTFLDFTGHEIWTIRNSGTSRTGLFNAPVAGQLIWAVDYDEFELRGVDPATGNPLQTIELDRFLTSIPALSGDEQTIWINNRRLIEGYDTATGELTGTLQGFWNAIDQPIRTDDVAFVSALHSIAVIDLASTRAGQVFEQDAQMLLAEDKLVLFGGRASSISMKQIRSVSLSCNPLPISSPSRPRLLTAETRPINSGPYWSARRFRVKWCSRYSTAASSRADSTTQAEIAPSRSMPICSPAKTDRASPCCPRREAFRWAVFQMC